MKLAKIEAIAIGNYSDKEYREVVYITEKCFKIIETDLLDFELYIPNLDGKHSEVQADIERSILSLDDLMKEVVVNTEDNEHLYCGLERILYSNGYCINEETKFTQKIIDYYDTKTSVEVIIPLSRVKQLEGIIEQWNKER